MQQRSRRRQSDEWSVTVRPGGSRAEAEQAARRARELAAAWINTHLTAAEGERTCP